MPQPFVATGLFSEVPSQASVVWVLVCTALVLVMQAGFGMLESGLSRAKHSIHVAIKNLADACLSMTVFWLVGFGLMFGASSAGWIGTSHFAVADGTSLLVFFAFQAVFCGTATTIVSGATAERMRFGAYMIVSAMMALLIYPIFGHWAWGGAIPGTSPGWLADKGFIDFAGSTVVHGIGGWAALAVVITLGPREGRFAGGACTETMTGHSYPIAAVGVILLWFGWLGFNGGSTLAVSADLGRIVVNTILAGAVGGTSAMAVGYARDRSVLPTDLFGGVVAGLVAVTAGCHAFNSHAAIVIAAIGGVVFLLSARLLDSYKVDDVVGAVPAHAVAGAWGTIATGLFAEPEFLAAGLSRWQQVNVQLLGVGVAFAWAFATVGAIAFALKKVGALRVSADAEEHGLNVTEHGTSTATLDLLREMNLHGEGRFDLRATVDPHTEVGQIAEHYNAVLDRVAAETQSRLEAAAALRQAEAEYRLMFENSLEGIYRRSADGSFTSANMSYALLLGFSCPNDLIEAGPDQVAARYEDGRFPYNIMDVSTGREFRSTIVVEGEQREILERIRVLRRPDGEVLWIQAAVADITETLRSQQLEHEVEVAQAASAAKSEFLASMSHELRTPLHGVVGMLDIMQQTELDAEQSTLLSNARLSADALLSQINDVLDLSKVEAGMLDVRPVPFDVAKLVENIVGAFRGTVDPSQVELVCDLSPSLPPSVVGDGDRIRQILANLIGNAVKFTREGEIRVSVDTVADDRIQFLVSDTGPGMDESIVATVFQPYTQGKSQSSHCKGTGLGLAITSQLTELMGGEIHVTSEVGRGSTFTLVLPLPMAEPDGKSTIADDRLDSLRILAVDDRQTNLDVITHYLTDAGHDVTTLSDPTRVEDLLAEADATGQSFDAVVLDHQMPERDGVEVAAHVHGNPTWESLPIIMASSAALGVPDDEIEIAKIDVVIEKPIRRTTLLNKLKSIFDARNSEATSETVAASAEVSAAGARVLVAEDNSVNQCFARHVLESIGCNVTLVDDGGPAIEAFRDAVSSGAPYDVVFMDCQMLETDGFEATRGIRAWEADQQIRETPIIALTANAIVGDREQCLAAGMSDYLTKPISSNAIRGIVIQVLTEQRERKAEHGSADSREAESAVDQSPGEVNANTMTSGTKETDAHPVDIDDVDTEYVGISAGSEEHATAEPREKPVETTVEPPLEWIDFGDLRERCLDDDEFVVAVLTQFSEELPEEYSQLHDAIETKAWDEASRRAHALCGFSGNVAAAPLSDLARRIEASISSQESGIKLDTSEIADELYYAVEQTLVAVESGLDDAKTRLESNTGQTVETES